MPARIIARGDCQAGPCHQGSRDCEPATADETTGWDARAPTMVQFASTTALPLRLRSLPPPLQPVLTLLVLDLGLDVLDGVAAVHLKGDGLAGQRLDKDCERKASRQVSNEQRAAPRKPLLGTLCNNAALPAPRSLCMVSTALDARHRWSSAAGGNLVGELTQGGAHRQRPAPISPAASADQ